MLQSPTNFLPESSFRLQTLMHGRSYMSPVQVPSLQQPGGPIDPSQYRGFLCHQAPQRLPHFSLAVSPGDILHQYQPHVAFSQPGFPHPSGLMSTRRTHLQPPSLESFSQTMFNLSQQSPQLPSLPHSVGVALQQQTALPTIERGGGGASGGGVCGMGGCGGNPEDAVLRPDSFSLRGMPSYFESRDSRLSDKNQKQDLSLKSIGLSNHHASHLQVQSKHLGADDAASRLHHSQLQQPRLLKQAIHRSTASLSRDDDGDEMPINRNDNDGTPLYLISDKFNNNACAWKPLAMHQSTSGVNIFFKDPNAVGIYQPTDRSRVTSIPSAAEVLLSSAAEHVNQQSPLSSPSAQNQSASSNSCFPVRFHRHFSRGSVIQLASGQLKRVEELRTEDFLDSGEGIAADLSVDMSRVTHIRLNHDTGSTVIGFAVGKKQIKVTVEATLEHPFFVFNRGWSSCNPSKTLDRYGLLCHQLAVGDVCISLTHRYPSSPETSFKASKQHLDEPFRKGESSSPERPPIVSPLTMQRAHVDAVESTLFPSFGNSPQRDEDKYSIFTQTVSPAPAAEHPSRTRGGDCRKRRWSAPEEARNNETPSKAPVLSVPTSHTSHPPVVV